MQFRKDEQREMNLPVSCRMSEPILHENKTFSNVNYVEKPLDNREFVKCEFINCDFTKSILSGNSFTECTFKQCNFSMAVITGTGFQDAVFIGCKMLGVDFTRCSKFMFSFTFTESVLDYCTFYGTKLKKTIFTSCSLKEADFTETDLSGTMFDKCDLLNAKFSNTILEKTDFRTALNFSIDPEFNKMKKARFAVSGLTGLLDKYNLDIEGDF